VAGQEDSWWQWLWDDHCCNPCIACGCWDNYIRTTASGYLISLRSVHFPIHHLGINDVALLALLGKKLVIMVVQSNVVDQLSLDNLAKLILIKLFFNPLDFLCLGLEPRKTYIKHIIAKNTNP
jgi:hypothetical protein